MANQPNLVGELVVVALKARDLPNREIVGKQDPFCIFRLGETAKRTKTDYRGGQHPLWDDQVIIPVPKGKDKMHMQVFDEDASREDLISEGEVELSKVLQDGEQDGWFPLKYRGKPAGQIYLELTFYSARPPPKRQPTRFNNKRTSYQQHGYHQQPPPPVPSGSHPASSQATTQAPARPSAGPPIYQPPRPSHPHDQAARPHMPPVLSPSTSSGTSTSAGPSYPPSNRLSPQYAYQPQSSCPPQHGYIPQQTHSPPRPGYPPQNGYPPQHTYPPQHGHSPQQPPQPQAYQPVTNIPQGDTPLLTSTFSPQRPSPPASQHGSQPPMGFNAPPFSPAGYPPPQNGMPGSTFAFPEPQPYHGGYTPYINSNGQPFAAHQSPYPSPAASGYPPASAAGAANTNGYRPAGPGYPQYGGYPPYQQPSYPPY